MKFKYILVSVLLGATSATWATGSSTPAPTPTPSNNSSTSKSDSNANASAGAAAGAVSGSWSGSNATGGNSNAAGGAGGNSNATGGTSNAAGGAASASIGDMTASGGMGGIGQGGTSSLSDNSRANTYVFPAPVSAAPLPGTICPKGDSVSWSIGWNFFSYARSSTRTELECLERYAELFKAKNAQQQPVMPSMYVVPFSTVPEARLTDTTPEPAPVVTPIPVPVNPVQPASEVKPAVVPKKAPAKESTKPAATVIEPNCGEGEVLSCQPKKGSSILKKNT